MAADAIFNIFGTIVILKALLMSVIMYYLCSVHNNEIIISPSALVRAITIRFFDVARRMTVIRVKTSPLHRKVGACHGYGRGQGKADQHCEHFNQ